MALRCACAGKNSAAVKANRILKHISHVHVHIALVPSSFDKFREQLGACWEIFCRGLYRFVQCSGL